MNSNNEKHFCRRLNIQVCELLEVLTEAAIERYFEKQMFLEFWNTINNNLNLAKIFEILEPPHVLNTCGKPCPH